MRLDKLLSNMGLGTRSEIKKDIGRGSVLVNGMTIKKVAYEVNEKTDEILFKGKPVQYEAHVYLMLNKPKGYISATEDPKHKTVIDLFKTEYGNRKLFPVGRLDIDTEGFLLVTDDGAFSHNLMSPNKHISKVYYADIEGLVLEEHVEAFLQGLVLEDGYQCKPAVLEIISSGNQSQIEVTLTEGKFHQVKRMFNAIGTQVTYLKRIRIGDVDLDEKLSLGAYRPLNDVELKKIKP